MAEKKMSAADKQEASRKAAKARIEEKREAGEGFGFDSNDPLLGWTVQQGPAPSAAEVDPVPPVHESTDDPVRSRIGGEVITEGGGGSVEVPEDAKNADDVVKWINAAEDDDEKRARAEAAKAAEEEREKPRSTVTDHADSVLAASEDEDDDEGDDA